MRRISDARSSCPARSEPPSAPTRARSTAAIAKSDEIDAAGLAQARERFAFLGRDVSELSDDQLRNLVSELERRLRDEGLTSAAQAATIILEGVKANRWRILVGVDAHKIDEMVRQSPVRAYDVAFFDEFASAAAVDRAP